MSDLRYAVRQLLRRPGFAAAAVVTLGLGIGSATAIFGAADAILLRRLPYPGADRLTVVWEHHPGRGRARNLVASVNFLAWRERARSFESLAAYGSRGLTLSAGEEAVRASAGAVTPEMFDVFGVRPALGRAFDAGEAEREEPVVVLSHGTWQRIFGGDPDAVGSTVRIEGQPYRVLGVMPREFELPEFPVLWWTLESPDLWVPLRPSPEYQGRSLAVFGKLAPGVTLEGAQAEMTALAGRLAAEREYDEGWSANVVALHEQVVGEARTPLLVLLGAVGFLLIIACANVTHLLLARAALRRDELALRVALGAGRGRLVRQGLTESLVLAALAAGLGTLLAGWGTRALVLLHPDGIPRAAELSMDARALAIAVGVSLVAALLSGLLPALRASRQHPAELMGSGGRVTASAGRNLRRVLIAGEVALSLALLVGAGLLGRSLLHLHAVDPGFDPEGRLTFRVALPNDARLEDPEVVDFFSRLVSRVGSLPGAGPAAAALTLPFGGLGIGTSFLVEGHPDPGRADRPVADVRPVTPGYFEALGIRFLAGRDFDGRDRPDAPRPYIVNETLARTWWPGESALGKELRVSLGEMLPGRVVGVVEDVRLKSLGEPPRGTIYMPHAYLPADGMYVVVRAVSDPAGLVGMVRGAVSEMGRDLPVHDVATLEERIEGSLAAERFRTVLLGVFAGLALLLAAAGLYGVVSHSGAQRTREIAIRMAIGARAREVLRQVLRESLVPTLAGVAAGLLAALFLTRLLGSLLFALDPLDPVTLLGTVAVLVATSVLAAWLPAWRATRVDPARVLRAE